MIKRLSINLIRTLYLLIEKLQGKYSFDFNDFSLPKEPTLFLCNHQMNFDAVRLRAHINKPISFVAHDELFKNKLIKWISTYYLDLICRGKNKSDTAFIKNIIKAKNNKKNIGIFPEGGINYFNHSTVIDLSLSKLCKKLNMPIVVLNVCGGSFVYPRYAKHKGKNKVEYKIKNIYYPDFYKNLSVTEFHSLLKKDLYINDYDWQKKVLSNVNRKSPTKYLYKNLFVCPDCKNMHSLKFDKNNRIDCIKCKQSFTINIYDFIEGTNNINNFVEWDKLQYLILKNYLPTTSDKKLLLIDSPKISYTKKTSYFKRKYSKSSIIKLYKDKLLIKAKNHIIAIPTCEISDIYIEYKNTLQFSHNDIKYRIDGKHFASYIWATYLRTLNNSVSKYLYI